MSKQLRQADAVSPGMGTGASSRKVKTAAATAAAILLAACALGTTRAAAQSPANGTPSKQSAATSTGSNQNANPTGAQNVNVVNTPTVHVASLPTITLSGPAAVDATVANTKANPVVSLDLERKSRIPYESTVAKIPGTCPAGVQTCFFTFTAPPTGFRLVVESVSGLVILDTSATAPPIAVLSQADSAKSTAWAYPGALGQPNPGFNVTATFNATTRAVFDPSDINGGAPSMYVFANFSSGSYDQFMTLSGYLEDCSITGCPAKVH